MALPMRPGFAAWLCAQRDTQTLLVTFVSDCVTHAFSVNRTLQSGWKFNRSLAVRGKVAV